MLDLSNPALSLSYLPSTHILTQVALPTSSPKIIKLKNDFENLILKEDELKSFTETSEEISLIAPVSWLEVCPIPDKIVYYKVIKIKGPLELKMLGVLAELSRILALARITIFVISTWNTDYIFIGVKDKIACREVLKAEGWNWKCDIIVEPSQLAQALK